MTANAANTTTVMSLRTTLTPSKMIGMSTLN